MKQKKCEINKAIEIMGGDTKVAKVFGITRQSVQQWRIRGQVPIEYAFDIARLSKSHPFKLVSPDVRRLYYMCLTYDFDYAK